MAHAVVDVPVSTKAGFCERLDNRDDKLADYFIQWRSEQQLKPGWNLGDFGYTLKSFARAYATMITREVYKHDKGKGKGKGGEEPPQA